MNRLKLFILGMAIAMIPLCALCPVHTNSQPVPVIQKLVITDILNSCFQIKVTTEFGRGHGSGFMYKPGVIATAAHVLEGATDITIVDNAGNEYCPQRWCYHSESDVGFVFVDVLAMPINICTEIQIGDTVYIVGTPFCDEFRNSVTKGILSGKRNEEYPNLQMDCAANMGNSGGVILNEKMEVIGILNMLFSPDRLYCGITRGIPIDVVETIWETRDEICTSNKRVE